MASLRTLLTAALILVPPLCPLAQAFARNRYQTEPRSTLDTVAQNDTSKLRVGCLRGYPAPRCRSFWITEFELAVPIAGTRTSPDDDALAAWRLGHMWNVGSRHALGAAASVEITGDPRFGILTRYRRWITSSTAIDFSPGVFTRRIDEWTSLRSSHREVGFTGQVGVAFKDVAGLTARIEWMRPQQYSVLDTRVGASPIAIWIGARLGAKPGILAGTIGPAALLGLLALLCAANGGCGD